MANEVAVSSAIAFFQAAPTAGGSPYNLAFSVKSSTSDIAGDALKFSGQLVTQMNQTYGTDNDVTTFNIDEFTRFASGDKQKKFSEIEDISTSNLIRDTFDEITGGGKSIATASNLSEYIRLRDTKDGKTDGHAVINFLI